MQQMLFPIVLEDAEPIEIGAHLRKVGHDEQGRRFYVKRLIDGNWLPLTEWLCHNIAFKCGIPTPNFAIALDAGNQLEPVFASQFMEGHIVKKAIGMAQVVELINGRVESLVDVLFLDLVLRNPDRGFGNMIFVNGLPSLYAFDYGCSKALKAACGVQMDDCKDKTMQTLRIVMRAAKDKNTSINTTRIIDKIQKVSTKEIEEILENTPNILMQQAGINCIIDWWKTNKLQAVNHAKSTFLDAEISAV